MNKLLIISLNGDPLAEFGSTHVGGQCKYILELGKNLLRRDWKIDVYTIKNQDFSESENITENFKVIRFSLPNNKNYGYDITDDDLIKVKKDIIEYIKSLNYSYDVILACYWLSGLVAIDLKKEIDKRSIVTFCSLGYFKKEATNSKNLDERIKKEKFIAETLEHIIATSKEEKKILTQIYKINPNKISIIPRGVDFDLFYKSI